MAKKKKKSKKKETPVEKTVKISAAKGRPMLTWVGKRPLSQVTAFPLQLVEYHDALNILGINYRDIETHEQRLKVFRELREQWNAECWKNQPSIGPIVPESGGILMHGDNKECLAALLNNGYRGKFNLIYIDPPYDSGADYVRKVTLRGSKGLAKIDSENYSLGEQIQYTDIWANDNYLQFMYERLLLLKELLAENGTICLHCDSSKNHHLRTLLDEVFGVERFRNEIIWFYENKLGTGGNTFDSRHDSIFIYTNGNDWSHNDILVEVKEVKPQPVTQKVDGKRIWIRDESGNRMYQESSPERPVGDVWIIPIINPVASERTGFPTQKPEELLKWIISACSNPGDLILDCFIGSGTTAKMAQELGRRWIGCDINKGAIQTSVKRLRSCISEQIKTAVSRVKEKKETLIDTEGESDIPKPAQFGFSVYKVNDYDLQVQHNEAVNLACEHIGIQRSRSDSYFDGTLGRALVKIISFSHPLSPLDLEELRRELDARPDEDRDITIVCLGIEVAARTWTDDWNRLRKSRDTVNRIKVIELRTDPKYGKFILHQTAQAKVKIKRKKEKIAVEVEDFISPTIIERLQQQAGLLQPKIDDWRSMVDCIMVDTAYNGKVFNVVLADVPEKKSDLVQGDYELPAPSDKTRVAVKITDMLGEEVVITKQV